MKQIKKVVLKEATKLSQEEMKHVFGGSGSMGSGSCAASCRDKDDNILLSGQVDNCESGTVRAFCSRVKGTHHSICVGPLGSGLFY